MFHLYITIQEPPRNLRCRRRRHCNTRQLPRSFAVINDLALEKMSLAHLPTELHLQLLPLLDYRSVLNLCATSQYFRKFQVTELDRASLVALKESSARHPYSLCWCRKWDDINQVSVNPLWSNERTFLHAGFNHPPCKRVLEEHHTVILSSLWGDVKQCAICLWRIRDAEGSLVGEGRCLEEGKMRSSNARYSCRDE